MSEAIGIFAIFCGGIAIGVCFTWLWVERVLLWWRCAWIRAEHHHKHLLKIEPRTVAHMERQRKLGRKAV